MNINEFIEKWSDGTEHSKNEMGKDLQFLQSSTMSEKLIDEIIIYIEGCEETIDREWGLCRSINQLIEDNLMPEFYNQVIALKQTYANQSQQSK